jgi:serine/threonine protein kinase
LAENTGMQRQVAVKVLPRELVNDKSYLERFQREARLAASLDHANIVRAFDFDHSDELYYLVMEYVDGQDLASLVKARESPLEIGRAIGFIRQAATGLHHAHSRGIIHRDIKPSNLLVDRQDGLKILDLGLARYAAKDAGSVTEVHHENVLGTADYLSPEQALDSRNVDFRTDIYSLGCTLYFCLVGHPPFPSGSIAQRIAQHQNMEPAPLRSLRPELPLQIEEICQRMMRKRPDERFSSAQDVETALAALDPGPNAPCFPTAVPSPGPSPRGPATARGAYGGPPDSTLASPSAAGLVALSREQAPANEQVPGSNLGLEQTEALLVISPSEDHVSLKKRLSRPTRVKRPPWGLWLVLAILLITLAVLTYQVASR